VRWTPVSPALPADPQQDPAEAEAIIAQTEGAAGLIRQMVAGSGPTFPGRLRGSCGAKFEAITREEMDTLVIFLRLFDHPAGTALMPA